LTKHAVRFHFDIFGPIQVTREKDEYDKDRDMMTVVLTVRDDKSRNDKHTQVLADDVYRGDILLMDLFPSQELEKLE
jgi:hypothetical protein